VRRHLVTIGIENPSLGLQAEACGVLRCAVSLVAAGLNQPQPVRLDDLWRLALRLEKCRLDWQAGWIQSRAPEPKGL
jgi:hypothetical protein